MLKTTTFLVGDSMKLGPLRSHPLLTSMACSFLMPGLFSPPDPPPRIPGRRYLAPESHWPVMEKIGALPRHCETTQPNDQCPYIGLGCYGCASAHSVAIAQKQEQERMKNKILGLPLDADEIDRRAFVAGRPRAQELEILGMSREQRLVASFARSIGRVGASMAAVFGGVSLMTIDALLPAMPSKTAHLVRHHSRLTITSLLPTLFAPLCPAKRPQRSRS